MKKMLALGLALLLLSPAVAFAGGSAATNAALGLGAFAVFNQILGGVGLFGGFAPAAAPAYVAPPPVVYAPPPVVYAPPPVVYAPPRVVYAPPPAVFVAPPVIVPRAVVVRPHHYHPYGPGPYGPVVYRNW